MGRSLPKAAFGTARPNRASGWCLPLSTCGAGALWHQASHLHTVGAWGKPRLAPTQPARASGRDGIAPSLDNGAGDCARDRRRRRPWSSPLCSNLANRAHLHGRRRLRHSRTSSFPLSCGAVGALVASRQLAKCIGWLVSVHRQSVSGSCRGALISTPGTRLLTHPAELPAAVWALWLDSWVVSLRLPLRGAGAARSCSFRTAICRRDAGAPVALTAVIFTVLIASPPEPFCSRPVGRPRRPSRTSSIRLAVPDAVMGTVFDVLGIAWLASFVVLVVSRVRASSYVSAERWR